MNKKEILKELGKAKKELNNYINYYKQAEDNEDLINVDELNAILSNLLDYEELNNKYC